VLFGDGGKRASKLTVHCDRSFIRTYEGEFVKQRWVLLRRFAGLDLDGLWGGVITAARS
jgi:hypothetical protein